MYNTLILCVSHANTPLWFQKLDLCHKLYKVIFQLVMFFESYIKLLECFKYVQSTTQVRYHGLFTPSLAFHYHAWLTQYSKINKWIEHSLHTGRKFQNSIPWDRLRSWFDNIYLIDIIYLIWQYLLDLTIFTWFDNTYLILLDLTILTWIYNINMIWQYLLDLAWFDNIYLIWQYLLDFKTCFNGNTFQVNNITSQVDSIKDEITGALYELENGQVSPLNVDSPKSFTKQEAFANLTEYLKSQQYQKAVQLLRSFRYDGTL